MKDASFTQMFQIIRFFLLVACWDCVLIVLKSQQAVNQSNRKPLIMEKFILLLFLIPMLLSGQSYLTENFDEAFENTAPNGWSNYLADSSSIESGWNFDNPANRIIPAPINNNFALLDSDFIGPDLGPNFFILESPEIALTSSSNLQLEFDHQFRSFEDSYGAIEIWAGGQWEEVYNTGSNDIGYSFDQMQNSTVHEIISLEAQEEGAYKFRFVYFGDFDYWWAIDNVVLRNILEQDLSIVQVVLDETASCFVNPETIGIEIQNMGSEDFALDGLSINVFISEGGNDYNYEMSLNQGSLLVDSSEIFYFELSDINFDDAAANYEISFEISSEADQLLENNSLSQFLDVQTAVDLPFIETGENMEAWTQSREMVFGNEMGAWQNSAFGNDESDLNGQAFKINYFGNEKKDYLLSDPIHILPSSFLSFDLKLNNAGTATIGSFDSDDVLVFGLYSGCDQESFSFVKFWNSSSILDGKEVFDLSEFEEGIYRISFLANEGNFGGIEDLDLFIDNIELVQKFEMDLAVLESQNYFEEPCEYMSVLPYVHFVNNGLESLELENDDYFTFSWMVDGEELINFNDQYFEELTMAPGDSLLVYLEEVPSLLPDAEYQLEILLHVNEDQNEVNDFLNFEFSREESFNSIIKFEAYDGFNLAESYWGWSESNGIGFDTEGSFWSSAFFNNNEISLNGRSAKISLNEMDLNEKIMSQAMFLPERTALFFDLLLVNDEMIEYAQFENSAFFVLASTDCWEQHDTIFQLNAASNSDGFEEGQFHAAILLDAYFDQTVSFAFGLFNAEVEDKTLFMDNIHFTELLENDIELLQVVEPKDLKCFGAEENLQIKVRNKGFNEVYFTQENMTFTIDKQGGLNETIEISIEGNLAALKDTIVTLNTGLDLSLNAIYSIQCLAEYDLDQNAENDTLVIERRNWPADFTIADGMDFEDYDGENLKEEYPGWEEAYGKNHPDYRVDSKWDNDFFANDPEHPNFNALRINLFQTGKDEWLLGPLISPVDSTVLIYDLALCNFGTQDSTQLGSDDQLQFLLSFDCGESYEAIRTYDSNSVISPIGQKDTIDLGAFAGQEVLLAIYATEGLIDDEVDTELFLDSLIVKGFQFPPGDVGSYLLFSEEVLCNDEPGEIIIGFQNYSSFTLSDFVVITELQGAYNEIFYDTVDYNLEAFDDGFAYHPIYPEMTGVISLKSYTNLAGDSNNFNDTLYAEIEVLNTPVFDLGPDTVHCGTMDLELNVMGDFTNVSWSTQDTTEQIFVELSGEYKVEVSNEICSAKDTIEIEIKEFPLSDFYYEIDSLSVFMINTSEDANDFEWNFGDGESSDAAAGIQHIYADTGQYFVQLIATDSLCGSDTSIQLIELVLLSDTMVLDTNGVFVQGLIYEDFSGLQIYPNPVKDFFKIKSPKPAEPFELLLLDSRGAILSRNKTAATSEWIESELPPFLAQGLYFILLKYEQEIFVGKLLKE